MKVNTPQRINCKYLIHVKSRITYIMLNFKSQNLFIYFKKYLCLKILNGKKIFNI